MSSDYQPSRDVDLQIWSTNFSNVAAGSAAILAISAAELTTLSGLVADFTAALATAKDPSTRTPSAIVAKNAKRIELTSFIRSLVRRFQANPAVSAQLKSDLAITIADRTPSPIPAPASKPLLTAVRQDQGSVEVR